MRSRDSKDGKEIDQSKEEIIENLKKGMITETWEVYHGGNWVEIYKFTDFKPYLKNQSKNVNQINKATNNDIDKKGQEDLLQPNNFDQDGAKNIYENHENALNSIADQINHGNAISEDIINKVSNCEKQIKDSLDNGFAGLKNVYN